MYIKHTRPAADYGREKALQGYGAKEETEN